VKENLITSHFSTLFVLVRFYTWTRS